MYSRVQSITVHYSTVLYSTVHYSTVLYCNVQYCTVQYNTVQYSAVQYSTVQCSAVQCSTVPAPYIYILRNDSKSTFLIGVLEFGIYCSRVSWLVANCQHTMERPQVTDRGTVA